MGIEFQIAVYREVLRSPKRGEGGEAPSKKKWVAGSAEGGLERLGAHRKVQETLQVVTGFRYPAKIFRLQTVLCYRTRQGVFPTSRTTANDAVRAAFAGRNLLG